MDRNQLLFGGLNEIRSWGWSPLQLATVINEFRKRTISGLTSQSFVAPDFFGELLFENDKTWKIIYEEPGQILGFWQMVPLTPAGYQLSLKGQVCGERIVRPLVQRMVAGGWYDTYFFSLSICPTLRKSLAAIRFAGTIIDSLVELGREGIFVNNISMCLASSYSMMINKFFLQFEYCSQHIVSGEMHQANLPRFLDSKRMRISTGKNMKELMQLYQDARIQLAAS